MRHTDMRIALFILEACVVVLMLITGIALFSGRSIAPFNVVSPSIISGTTVVVIGLLMVSEVILAGGEFTSGGCDSLHPSRIRAHHLNGSGLHPG
jgi:hypothetical protein